MSVFARQHRGRGCGRARPRGAVVAWVEEFQIESAPFRRQVGEGHAGIEITRDQDHDKAVEIETWIGRVAGVYNVLPWIERVPVIGQG